MVLDYTFSILSMNSRSLFDKASVKFEFIEFILGPKTIHTTRWASLKFFVVLKMSSIMKVLVEKKTMFKILKLKFQLIRMRLFIPC